MRYLLPILVFLASCAVGAYLQGSLAVAAEAPEKTQENAASAGLPYPYQQLLAGLTSPLINLFPPEKTRQDLTLGNFFTYGWKQGWSEPEEGPQDAPRFRLLRIQRAFWERELRAAYNFTFRANKRQADGQEGEFELELPISRRFLIEFEGGVVGDRPSGEVWKGGGSDLKVIPEVMLMESRDLSFSSGLFIRTPTGRKAAGDGRTSLTPYLALWRNLGHRIGLHTYLGAEFPLDGFAPGAPDAVFQYAIAPTITVTPKTTPYAGNLTFFLELNGETELGRGDRHTTITLLPGARWLVLRDIWLATGYEVPITHTNDLAGRVWASLYLDF